MPSMRSAARSMAAENLSGMSLPPGIAGETGEEAPELPVGETGTDMESALSMIEASLSDFPQDLQLKAREHIQALREISSQAGGGPAPDAEMPQEHVPPGLEEKGV